MSFLAELAEREFWINAASDGMKAYLRWSLTIDRMIGVKEAKRLAPVVTRFADGKELSPNEMGEILILILFSNEQFETIKEDALERFQEFF
jgi:hypothetical protein